MKHLMIILKYPDDVTMAEIKDYAKEALEVWGGQRRSDDPLFYKTKAPKSKMKAIGNVKFRREKSQRIA